MKKVLYILISCATLCVGSSAWASPAQAPAVESVSDQAAVYGGNGHIYFSAGSSETVFSIYSITGQLMKALRVAADSHASIEMPKGFYIVRCNTRGWSRKVVVK